MVRAAVLRERGDATPDPLLTLVETIEDLSSARTVDQVAGVIRSAARRITGADGVAFILRDEGRCFYLDEDAIGPLWKGRRFDMSECISGWCMLNAQTVVIRDIYQDPRIPHDAYRPTFVKSLVMTPVRPRDPIAAIGAYWASERQPTEDEVAKLQIMARATATALDSALMYASLSETLERRKFLLRELDHRCKNTLAAVQSIADQTLRHAQSPRHFVEAFNGRLGALSRAHELLTREEWGRAPLAEVLAQTLAAFGGVDGERIKAGGPPIRLAPETSVAMHMAFHELAVNAAKYGALSRDSGRLEVAWTVEAGADERPMLVLTWSERGGPPVTAEPRRGFGSRLIEQGIARDLNGAAVIDFDPQGVVFRLRAPLSDRMSRT
ncbi:MAG: HWE histidine kinase domain-containing protein [Phenylobacterium sp.]|uniref:sensor histidine kinase n=1 Tax=Phenylobacterium sp. TaxID=1871053 RepID=UPI0027376C22|nr:HWE histidine kinase domain-containing protein [Phenylobacterium sp.]MDP3748836.1 HWE histidine kinase domain-containing protein [Phenylobacterium sp.]